LKRTDHLYDLVLVIEYNTKKIIKGKGSAIFMHLAKPGYKPTQGCIALSKKSFLDILGKITPKEKLKLLASPNPKNFTSYPNMCGS
jgi:Uncharacterized protein conserved in bacteria